MKTITTFLFFCLSFGTFAQKDSVNYNPNIVRKLFYLKPLQNINGVYYYGDRKLSGYNSLEIPFFELNDPEVNSHYKRYKTFTGIGQAIGFIPTIYVLATLNKPRTRQTGFYTGTYLGVIGGALVGSITCSLIGRLHVKKAAIRYNQIIGKENTSYWQFKTDEQSLGMTLKYNF